jgi:hypothetical protein
MLTGLSLDELCGYADATVRLSQTAFENITHAEFAPDLLHINRAALVSKTRVAGDDKQ